MFLTLTVFGERLHRWVERGHPWTNVYGLARTLLAVGTALTLAVNRSEILFRPAAGIPEYPVCQDIGVAGAFCLGSGYPETTRAISVIILLVVANGWRPRYTAILHWWISFSLQTSAVLIDGGDQLTAVLTLLILPIALTDNRTWHWQRERFRPRFGLTEVLRRIAALTSLSVIRLQVCIVYFHALVGKLGVDDWVNGTVLYYWFTDPIVGLPSWLGIMLPLLRTPAIVIATWVVLVLESVLFMAMFMPKWAWKYCLLAGVLFHIAIALTMGLISFGIAMSAALVLYLRPFEQEFSLAWLRNFVLGRHASKQRRLAASPMFNSRPPSKKEAMPL